MGAGARQKDETLFWSLREVKSWRNGGCLKLFFFFLKGIESMEIAFFQQANFMGILKRTILQWESKAFMFSSLLFPFSLCQFYSPQISFLMDSHLPFSSLALSLLASEKNEQAVCGLLHFNGETLKQIMQTPIPPLSLKLSPFSILTEKYRRIEGLCVEESSCGRDGLFHIRVAQ